MAKPLMAKATAVWLVDNTTISFKQIADISGDPIGTLLARHHRALKKLRDLLDPQQAPQSKSGEAK